MATRDAGQATTEMIFLLPIFVILTAAAVFFAYIGWQGVKVQNAANLAARIAGQEYVGGAKDFATIMQDNGLVTSLNVQAAGDGDPTECAAKPTGDEQRKCIDKLANGKPKLAGGPTSGGLYWSYRRRVYEMFSAGEQDRLFVPTPVSRNETIEVKVIRTLVPPKIMNWQMPPLVLVGQAYGGEDTYVYGLPRFGTVSGGPGAKKFWEEIVAEVDQRCQGGPCD